LAGIPFLVGGAYALREYTGVVRDTKDFDIFLCQTHLPHSLEVIRKAGWTNPQALWRAIAFYGRHS
jgi:hypothetical protein